MSGKSPPPVEVFISYSHEDQALREKLGKHLSILKRQRVIDEWHDRRIRAGQEWAAAIDEHLDSADVILLLVSADFLASDYCYELEMTRALQRHDAGDACVIPVILRQVDWHGASFAKLNALPRDGKPVTSWSNEDEAFTDVARGIREMVEELRAGPSRSRSQRLPDLWNVPYLRDPNFIGREALLDQLHQKLTDSGGASVVVRGRGGVGKTQLAIEYAYRHAAEFDLVWWVRAGGPASLLEDFAALSGPLGIGEAGEGDLAADADAVRQELTRWERWLLVFDNATQPDDLTWLLPSGGAGRVLVTSRNPSWPFAVGLDIPVLSRDAAVAFLLERTGEHDQHAADLVASVLGDLPLALAQAAAYVTETGIGLAGYVDLFRTREKELWGEEPAAGHLPAVGTSLATDRLRVEEPLAVDLLSLCAFLAPEPIPRRLLAEHHTALPEELGAAVADPLHLNRLVAALRRYSLVEVTGEALSFHRLVQTELRDELAPEESRHWIEAAVALMRAGFPYDDDDPTTWAPSGALLAHALAAAGHFSETAGDSEDTRWLLNQAALYFRTRAEFEQARAGFERALALAEAALGPDAPQVAVYLNNLGMTLQDLGDLAGARAAYERALRIGEEVYGPDHPHVAIYVNNLGLVLQDLGDLAGARAALERALATSKQSFGPDHPDVAIRVNNLGRVFQDLGDLAGARAAYERALEIGEQVYGPDHPHVAVYVDNLGQVLQNLGDLAGARAAYERALRIDENSFGPDHPNVATTVNNLGSVMRDLGDLASASVAFERALEIFERVLGPDHPNTRRVRDNLDSLDAG